MEIFAGKEFILFLELILVIGFIGKLTRINKLTPLFRYFPGVVWCYFIPMLLTSMGIFPQQSPVYKTVTSWFLPLSLFLLLIRTDVPAIVRLGLPAVGMMLVGSFGIFVGAPISLLIFKQFLPPDIWSGIGALSGSWTGGSANMLAVKESLSTPEHIFAPMIVIDTVVGYSWMGVMIFLAGYQDKINRWLKADLSLLTNLNQRVDVSSPPKIKTKEVALAENPKLNFIQYVKASGTSGLRNRLLIPWQLALGFIISFFCIYLGDKLPVIKTVTTPFTWTIILVTTLSLLLSITPVSKLYTDKNTQLGYWLLYLVLAAVGAQADLTAIFTVPVLVLLGIVWILIHAIILFGVGRLFRVPLFFIAAASQANIGGTATAPIVAEVYQPGLASVGLLLAILGNIIGTYLGILCGHLCRWVITF